MGWRHRWHIGVERTGGGHDCSLPVAVRSPALWRWRLPATADAPLVALIALIAVGRWPGGRAALTLVALLPIAALILLRIRSSIAASACTFVAVCALHTIWWVLRRLALCGIRIVALASVSASVSLRIGRWRRAIRRRLIGLTPLLPIALWIVLRVV